MTPLEPSVIGRFQVPCCCQLVGMVYEPLSVGDAVLHHFLFY